MQNTLAVLGAFLFFATALVDFLLSKGNLPLEEQQPALKPETPVLRDRPDLENDEDLIVVEAEASKQRRNAFIAVYIFVGLLQAVYAASVIGVFG
jgi:hypothetical protein